MSATLSSIVSGNAFAKCCPHYVEDFDRCAGISVCSVKPVMPDEWDTIYFSNGIPRVDSALAEADFVAKACLPKINGLYDWISATRRNWNSGRMSSSRKTSGVLEYEPYIKGSRRGPINNQWWSAVYSGASGGAEPAGTHKYVVTPLSSNIPASERWFHLEMQVFMFTKNDDGTELKAAGTVKAIDTVGADLVIWVLAAPDSGLPGVAGAAGYDEALLTRGLANISDYEEFCEQIPAINTRQDSYYWVGTSRMTICDSEIQKKFIERVMDNKAYAEYYHVDDVVYSRQMVEDYQMRQVENFFWGRALSDKQTYSTWDELPTITLDFDGYGLPDQGACVGRRANPIGIVNQLSECNRVIDLQGGQLDLVTHVLEQVYYMDVIRSENGVSSDVHEVWMNSVFAMKFQQAMIAYYKAKTLDTMRMNVNVTSGEQKAFGFSWRDWILDFPAGKTLRIMTHPFFDNWYNAFAKITSVDIRSQGNMMWFIDWSSIYQATINSSTVTNTTGNIQDLAKISQAMACRMKTHKTSYRHSSHTFTNVVECPAASLLIQNIGMQVPKIDSEITRFGIGSVPWDTTLSC